MVRTAVIKVLAQYSMSVRELKLGVARRKYNKRLLQNAHDLECALSQEVWLGHRRIYKRIEA